MEKVPYHGKNLTRWTVGNSTFLALPEEGALLMNWSLQLADGSIRDILYWPENPNDPLWKTRGGNPILFPFSGRSFVNGNMYQWRDEQGTVRPMPMHGLARQAAFKTTRLDPNGFTSLFIPDAEARAAYPYDYEFTVSYHFSSLGIACELRLKNLGQTPIPWSAGHHFYFTLPWTENLTRNDYKIRIPATKCLRHDYGTGHLVNGPKFKTTETLGNKHLLDTIHVGLKKNAVTLGAPDAPGEITVTHGQDKVPPPDAALLTWSESETAPYYCVEPWMGPPNAPETKRGLHYVAPSQSQSFVVSIAVK